jgi:PD-(D/E)XK nuclease superfamily
MSAVHLPVITNSEVRTFRRCHHEHHLAYGLGYRSVQEPEPLRFGSLMHLGLEAWWLADDDQRLERAIDAMAPHAQDEYELVRAGVLLQGYDARWAGEPLAPIKVEAEFRAPLLNPESGAPSRTYALAGKLDVIVRDMRDHLVYILEHKTTSEDIGAGSQYWQRLQLDPQISTYYAGAKAIGWDVAGCIYDVIGKPAIRPQKATPMDARKYTKGGRLYANQREVDETPDEFRERLLQAISTEPDRYFQRGTVVRLQAEERDAAFDVWQTARLIREAELAGRHPRNPDACQRFGRLCPFFGVCTGTESLEDMTLFKRVDNTHQELTSAA